MNVVVAYLKTPQHCFGAIEEHEDIPVGRFDGLVKRPNLGPPICATELLIILDPLFGAVVEKVGEIIGYLRGELSYLAPLGSENIPAPYFKQCFFQGGYYPPDSQTPRLPVPRQK